MYSNFVLVGIDAIISEVEVDVSKHGLEKNTIVGLAQAAVVEGTEVYPVSTLSQAVAFLNEQLPMESYELDGHPYLASQVAGDLDFVEVRGQEAVKRAITIVSAGAHNLLMLCQV